MPVSVTDSSHAFKRSLGFAVYDLEPIAIGRPSAILGALPWPGFSMLLSIVTSAWPPTKRVSEAARASAVVLISAPILSGCGGSGDGDVAFETTPDAAIEAAILAASPDYASDVDEVGSESRYLYSRIDLNGDGEDEVFVYLLGSYFCGSGGCNLQLFTPGADGYSLVSEFPISRTPVIVTSDVSNGWNDIWRFRSGGGAPANYIADRFDGTRYIDAEEIPPDDPPEGRRVLSGEFTFEQGIPLRPLR